VRECATCHVEIAVSHEAVWDNRPAHATAAAHCSVGTADAWNDQPMEATGQSMKGVYYRREMLQNTQVAQDGGYTGSASYR